MDKMTFISQSHNAGNEAKRSVSSKHAKEEFSEFSEIADLRHKLNKAKSEILELSVKHNEELSSCECRFVKLRSEFEKGEAIRQSLEYELAVARRQCNQERMALEEEKANSLRIQEQFQAQIEELQRNIYSIEKHFQTTQFNWQDAQRTFEKDLIARDQLIETCKKEKEMLMSKKKELEAVSQKQNKTINDLQQKLHELDKEKNKYMDAAMRQKSELGFSLEREERLKQELEAGNLRIKNLEENIEAERAAHLESKFNSEIIQLRIRDLEGSLQVEKASQTQKAVDLDLLKNQFREVEMAYNLEKKHAQEISDKLQRVEKEYSLMVNEFKAEIEMKNQVVLDLSVKLKNTEEGYTAMEQELAVTKKHQLSLEEAYGRHMRDLQAVVDSFAMPSHCISGTGNDKPVGPAVVEALRETLTDYQNKLGRMSNELDATRKSCAGMGEELEAAKQMIQSLNKSIENAHSEHVSFENELHRLRSICAEKDSHTTQLHTELKIVKDAREKEKWRVLECESEIQKITQAFQKDKEEKLTFLHRIYQRLVAGCVLIKQPERLLDSFSWPELCAVLQENLDVVISDLNRANEKVTTLENACKNKADVIKDLQQNYEDSLKNLTEQMKAQQSSWQKKSRDLEEHYSTLLREVNARAQKYQRLAEKSKDKFSVSEKTKDQMALENVHIKNLLLNTEKDHKSLLAACALMAGALYPLYSRCCSLAAQRKCLQDQMNAYVYVQNEICKLIHALSDSDARDKKDSKRSRNHSKCMKHVFRKCVIAVLAANRLQHLGGSSRTLFTWMEGTRSGPRILVCQGGPQNKQKILGSQDRQMDCQDGWKWLTSTDLHSAVVSSMSELLALFKQKDQTCEASGQIIESARNCFSKLMNKLNEEMRSGVCHRYSDVVYPDSLVQRLARGLHRINSQAGMDLNSTTPIMTCLAVLKKQILAYTKRLHVVELDRRSLRLELFNIKQTNNKNTGNQDSLKEQTQQSNTVPYEKFKRAFEELNNALLREQEAQILLNEQSQQMLALHYKIELHSKEEAEKDQTLSEAVQRLSEAKMELRRKDQSLRQQNRQLIQLEKDKHRLEESIYTAESVLRVAAKDKEILLNYMISIVEVLQKIKEQTSLKASRQMDFNLLLPKLTPKLFETTDWTGGAEFTACKNMISYFLDIYQFAYTKTIALEREITFHQKHIEDLKSELQSACFRENKNLSPVKSNARNLVTSRPDIPWEKSIPDFLPLQAELDLSHSHIDYNYLNGTAFKPIDSSSHTDLVPITLQERPNKT